MTTALSHSAIAQIVPDATLGIESSKITPNANVRGLPALLLEGGATRGVNLFQSFFQFNVGDGQRVYFANPAGIENILTRVTGSDPSKIFGTLGVDGRANLFFLNPNGIIFGQNARLDIAGSFLGTTANSFVFDNGLKFSATNPETAPLLTVSLRPGLQFGANQSASISNFGNLNVGQNLTLVSSNLDLQNQLNAGGDLTLQATDTLKVRDTAANPFIGSAGGKLTVQGNQGVDIFALNHPSSGFFSGGDMVLRSANTVGGDAHYWAGGNFRIEQLDGSLGKLSSPDDPIIRASGDVSFDSYTGASLHILAGGAVNIGSITITGADRPENSISEEVPLSISLPDGTTSVSIQGGSEPTLDIRAGTTAFGTPKLTPNFIPGITGIVNPNASRTSADINIGSIINANETSTGEPIKGQILLTNQYTPNGLLGKITTGLINTFGNVTIDSQGDIQTTDVIDVSLGFDGGNSIRFITNGNIITGGDLLSDSYSGNGGNITLISKNGGIDTRAGAIVSQAFDGVAGDVTLKAAGDIYLGNIEASSFNSGRGGNVNILAGGLFTLDNVFVNSETYGSGDAGNIDVAAQSVFLNNGAQLRSISKGSGNGGNIKLDISGDILISGVGQAGPSGIFALTQPNSIGDGGTIEVKAGGTISLSDRAEVKTDNNGSGLAGSIKITAGDKVSIDNSNVTSESNYNDESEFYSTIDITATKGSVFLNQARVSTTNLGLGYAGDISISARDDISILNSSNFPDQPESELKGIFSNGNLGNIFIGFYPEDSPLIPKKVTIDHSFLTTSNQVEGDNQENILAKDAGNILVRTLGDLFLTSSNFETATYGSGSGGNIYVEANSVSLSSKSSLLANTLETGKAGSVTVQTTGGAVSLSESSINTGSDDEIPTDPKNLLNQEGQGGGDINITTAALFLTNNSLLNASTFGSGHSGNVYITADKTVSFTDGSILNARTYLAGNAGNVDITTQSFSLSNQSLIQAETFGSGNGGNLNITTELFDLSNTSRINAQTFGSGSAGNVNIKAQSVSLTEGSRVNAGTFSSGKGGSITINPFNEENKATASVAISGAAPLIKFSSGLFVNTESIRADAGPGGDGGNITINTGTLSISNGAVLSAPSKSSGTGGNINIDVNNLEILGGGQILTNAYRSGQAGNLTITATDNITIAGQDFSYEQRLEELKARLDVIKDNFDFITPENEQELKRILGPINNLSGLFANTEVNSSGQGGTINIVDSNQVTIKDSAIVSVDSKGTGVAGSINITGNRLTLDNKAAITADTDSGQGGSITLNLQDLLLFRRQSHISTTAGKVNAGGDGGIITINLDPNNGFIVSPALENNDIVANAFSGSGGKIEISAKGVIGLASLTREELEQKLGTTDPEKLDPQYLQTNDITAISQTNPQLNGIVSINSPNIDPSKGIVSLPTNATDSSKQIAQGCAAGDEKIVNEFIDIGHGGLPARPDEFLSSDAVWEDIRLTGTTTQQPSSRNITASAPAKQKAVLIVPATGWVFNSKGEVTLISHTPNSFPSWSNSSSCAAKNK
ncbi:MAG: filamentous hemagglutinin N-terminal domain-containing protein [Mojavia pulchra JT2-VF2]|uniref:Filamentous hemagglutinin N-terminal domain-containing protein n=1 Tax=Mojavia pulchra JT2-VF2 TaxID=287848 RepID=A0A951Q1S6_9NOST|nr:filamentous hemagglutinin N-terminal domain-containing protein [Mojavia pulchra JT2-VF2]